MASVVIVTPPTSHNLLHPVPQQEPTFEVVRDWLLLHGYTESSSDLHDEIRTYSIFDKYTGEHFVVVMARWYHPSNLIGEMAIEGRYHKTSYGRMYVSFERGFKFLKSHLI